MNDLIGKFADISTKIDEEELERDVLIKIRGRFNE